MYYEKIAIAVTALALPPRSSTPRANWRAEAGSHSTTRSRTIRLSTSTTSTGPSRSPATAGIPSASKEKESCARKTSRRVDRAKREVKLDVNEKDGIAQLYVNGPFRDNHSSDDHGFHIHFDDHDYEVTYNFTDPRAARDRFAPAHRKRQHRNRRYARQVRRSRRERKRYDRPKSRDTVR